MLSGCHAGQCRLKLFYHCRASLVDQLVKNLPVMGDPELIPGSGRSPGEGIGYSLQYSGLENSIDCIVHGVAKRWTQLSNFHSFSGRSIRQLTYTPFRLFFLRTSSWCSPPHIPGWVCCYLSCIEIILGCPLVLLLGILFRLPVLGSLTLGSIFLGSASCFDGVPPLVPF